MEMPPKTRTKHHVHQHPPDSDSDSDIFAKPRVPFQERAGPSLSTKSTKQNKKGVSGQKAVTKTDGLELGPACRTRVGYGNTNGKDVRTTTTTCLPCSKSSAFNSTSNTPNPNPNPDEDEDEDEDGGAEREPELEPISLPSYTCTCTVLTPVTHSDGIGTDKYGVGDDSQFRPREVCRSNNCHDCHDHDRVRVRKQRRNSSNSNSSRPQRVQLLSDSEISVLDLGPSLRVPTSGGTSCCCCCTPEAEYCDKVQNDSVISTNSESEMIVLGGGSDAITSTNGAQNPNLPTQEKKDHAYERDVRKTSTFSEQRIGECSHCGNAGGYRSSASGHALVAPETGDVRTRLCKFDGAGDHECDCDFQSYDYDYGYGEDTPSAFTTAASTTRSTMATATTISSPVLAPLKTTREEPLPPPAGPEKTQSRPRKTDF